MTGFGIKAKFIVVINNLPDHAITLIGGRKNGDIMFDILHNHYCQLDNIKQATFRSSPSVKVFSTQTKTFINCLAGMFCHDSSELMSHRPRATEREQMQAANIDVNKLMPKVVISKGSMIVCFYFVTTYRCCNAFRHCINSRSSEIIDNVGTFKNCS